MNLLRTILFSVALFLAVFYSAYEIFWWALVMERSAWTRGLSTPASDAAQLLRDFIIGIKGT
jgi:hypothetical protein